ncbi:MAG: DNRLRE domain-containing protein [Aeoliella sp.]
MRINFRRKRKVKRLMAAAMGAGVATAGATAEAATISFQEGDSNGYAGTEDTWFSERSTSNERDGNPDGSFVRTALWSAANQQGLIKFNGIFGGSGVPLGAPINSASLTLHVPSDIQYSDGEQNAVHQMLIDWVETDAHGDGANPGPWSGGATGGVDLDDAEAASAAADLGPVGVTPQNMTFSLDVTSIVQNWSNGAGNYGFLLQSQGLNAGNGLFMASSEYVGADGIDKRPRLTVDYIIPEPTTFVLLGLGSVLVLLPGRFRHSW